MSIDTNSEAWTEVSNWAKSELELLTIKLEHASTDHLDTQYMRGKIRMLRQLLLLPETGVTISDDK